MYRTLIYRLPLFFCITFYCSSCYKKTDNETQKNTNERTQAVKNLTIILGSTRQGKASSSIGALLKKIADTQAGITTDIIDLSNYHLPFLYESVAPAKRTVFPDEIIKKWSETITASDAFVLLVPEYNGGYPGSLKNALDLLYKEWNNKPVILVGYSGGPSGASDVLKQLHAVVSAFKMTLITPEVTIPYSWKALDAEGNFVDQEHAINFKKALDHMIVLLNK